MYEEISEMLGSELRITGHSISKELIHAVFSAEGDDILELFPRRPAAIVTRVLDKYTDVVAALRANDVTVEQMHDAIEMIPEWTTDPERGDDQISLSA